ncbi:hypothetical protein ACG2F4_09990 [Halalkalibaculum sp. DA3122]|uniref:hypothetical protein n=1 Tax=unclassified Halalkalibaculum TaxID=2964617 RepID=UPI003754DE38
MSKDKTTPGEPEKQQGTDAGEIGNPEIEREISLEEFQPTGTLTLVLLYFVIIVLMWIFMYFVEFAGNSPSIMN